MRVTLTDPGEQIIISIISIMDSALMVSPCQCPGIEEGFRDWESIELCLE